MSGGNVRREDALGGTRCIPLERMRERVNVTRTESETALVYDLLYAGEMAAKLAVAGLVATTDDDRERHRYRIEHGLVRASGIGDWARALTDPTPGTYGLRRQIR
jgi:hypothetical protein